MTATAKASHNLKIVDLNSADRSAKSAGEALKERRSASHVQPPDGKLREIDNELANQIQADIREFANTLSTKYKIDIATTSRSFPGDSPLALDVTIKMSALHGLGFNRFSDALLREKGKKHGLRAKHYGVSFLVEGTEHIIKGFDENPNGKEPFVILQNPSGQVLALVSDTVKVLKQKGIL
ncbi:hypothetical protein [Idiomarina abyssalis]|uniref:Uncharacterized protein n=1 Tax=Idiomarina abyssalis TaxID=86102 RepID=A0A8I1G6U7_9GAMM|nr:hypothetical protein [Idiomarina abyssalis]MBJ7265472.1 hypothetical protein [Idiomarina abyssalis]MBJ7316854.1 hypothetical protein [Idiomarina abyssalis]